MKPLTRLKDNGLLKVAFYIALGLTIYWLLDHWPDFKKAFLAGLNGQASP